MGVFAARVAAFILPTLAIVALGRFAGADPRAAFGLPIVFQATMTALLWWLLERNLRRRTFVLARADKSLLV